MDCDQKRILVVGEVPDGLEVEKWVHTQVCPHRDKALSLVREDRYQVVLIRLEPDEIQFLRELRLAQPDLRVIVLASNSTPEMVLAAMEAKAFSFFSQPFLASAVHETICQGFSTEDWEDSIRIVSAEPDFATLHLSCRMCAAERLLQFMDAMPIDLPPQERSALCLAFRELLLNAVEHGGKLDPNEWVRVSRVRTARTLVYHIQDPGEGFRQKDLAHAAVNHGDDPLEHVERREAMGLRPGGFGMLVAREMLDEIIYNESGNEVILIKHLV